jgi:1-acyl-sn-glycerol-3-phosphate acyltransferase
VGSKGLTGKLAHSPVRNNFQNMSFLRGIFRLLLILIVLVTGTGFVLLFAWLPLRWRGVRLSAWMVTGMARAFMRIFDIHFHCSDPEKIRGLRGFIFPNHTTYLDILAAVYLLPARFVAKAEIGHYPFIGSIARAIGCVFVERQNKASRAKARDTLAKADRYPPIILFPEGKTGTGEALAPFRHGAFAVAIESKTAFLPCVLVYDRPEIVRWLGDPFTRAIWRLASRPGPVAVHLITLELVQPEAGMDAAELAEATHCRMAAALAEAETRYVISKQLPAPSRSQPSDDDSHSLARKVDSV